MLVLHALTTKRTHIIHKYLMVDMDFSTILEAEKWGVNGIQAIPLGSTTKNTTVARLHRLVYSAPHYKCKFFKTNPEE